MKRKDEDMTGKPAADPVRWVNRPMGKVYGPPMTTIMPDEDEDDDFPMKGNRPTDSQ